MRPGRIGFPGPTEIIFGQGSREVAGRDTPQARGIGFPLPR